MRNRIVLLFTLFFLGMLLSPSAFAQVEGPEVRPDTIYLYEEQVTYDTLYIYDSLPRPSLMSKDQLIETYKSDRGIGKMLYQNGKMYIAGVDKLYRLDKTDLKEIFSAIEYDEYCKAKRNSYLSIPLYVAGAGAVACAGVGLYQFIGCFVMMSKGHDLFFDHEDLAPRVWLAALGGMAFFASGAIVAAGCLAPAIILTLRSKARLNNLANEFGTPTTSMRLDFGPTPMGVGLSLSF